MTTPTSLSEGIVSRRLLRLAMVAALPLLALACTNDSPPAGGGTGGSNGTGGSAAGTGGTSGGTGGTDLWSISPAGMATIMVAGGEMHAQSTSGSYASTSTVVGGLTAKCVDVT